MDILQETILSVHNVSQYVHIHTGSPERLGLVSSGEFSPLGLIGSGGMGGNNCT
jgi:hypothetical protein